MPEKHTLTISGMSCASCAAKIEASLNKLTGVTANVNFVTETATVDISAGGSTAAVLQTVQELGYSATLSEPNGSAHTPAAAADSGGLRLLVTALTAAPVVFLAMFEPLQFPGWQWVSLALTLFVYSYGGTQIHRLTLAGLRHKSVSMHTLVTLSTTAALLWSIAALLWGGAGSIGFRHHMGWHQTDASQQLYLESVAAVITLVTTGKWIESRAKTAAGSAVSQLAKLQPETARLLRNSGDRPGPHPAAAPIETQTVPVQELAVGDYFVVLPGDRIAADGEVEVGTSEIDVSAMTGESLPATVTVGDSVTAGTANLTGRLVVRATRVGADTALAQIASITEAAQQSKARTQRLVDAVSRVFVPTVLALSCVTLAAHLLFGSTPGPAFSAAVAVLVIACPCALGLATPIAMLVGTGRAAQLGVLITGPAALEHTRNIDTVVFDKTGTLTTGEFRLQQAVAVSQDGAVTEWTRDRAQTMHTPAGYGDVPDRSFTATSVPALAAAGAEVRAALRLVALVEAGSTHPLARALVSEFDTVRELAADSADVPPVADSQSQVSELRTHAGLGATAQIDGVQVCVGSLEFLEGRQVAVPDILRQAAGRVRDAGNTVVMLAAGGAATAVFGLRDSLAAGASETVAELRGMRIEPVMLTGDSLESAHHTAAPLGITTVYANTRPDDKQRVIQRLQDSGRTVAMLGDGINDTAALAQANCGIAVAGATAITADASDMLLLRGGLTAVPGAIRLAQKTFGTIRSNLFWAFIYNVCAIPLAAFGLLTPTIAAFAMVSSSLFVVANSLRLRRVS